MATHNQVAHAWAHQTGKQRRGPNMFYDGATIYSYGRNPARDWCPREESNLFPIARLVTIEGREAPLVMFTTATRSVSTAKHKSIVWRAAHHLTKIAVANVNADDMREHCANYDAILCDARDKISKAARARKFSAFFLDGAHRRIDDANFYASQFLPGLAEIKIEQLDSAVAEIAARAETARVEDERRTRERKRAEALAKHNTLRRWIAGEDVFPPHTRMPYVRVRGDVVQTSWGAEVPLSSAIKVWDTLKHVRRTGTPCEVDGGQQNRVGDFRINAITPRGIRVGCHFIPWCAARIAADYAGIV